MSHSLIRSQLLSLRVFGCLVAIGAWNSPGLSFADDPVAAQAELAGWTDTTFITGHTAEEDLRLIQQCRHAIISNSTFGWWGGWLIAPAPDKIIVAPKQWFSEAMQKRKPPRDIYGADWVKL